MEYTIGTKVFGDWEIVAALGEGANGKVFEIHKDTKYGGTSKAALKLIRVPQSDAEVRAALAEGMDDLTVTGYFRGVVEEIIKEINIMESLKSSTGIVICEDSDIIEHAGSFGWDILIRMELLTSLQEYQRKHRMEEDEVLHMAQNLCSALMFCQKKGMIHRDIKPGNIFVNEEGDFKLGDFGVARTLERTTGGLSKKGTESYMAPEVYLSKPYGASVDMYSLGLVLYQALNDNRLPFMPPAPQPIRISDRENALNRRVVKGEPLPAPRLASPEFAKVILKACAWNPDDRYSTAAEMLEEVNRIVANRLLGTAGWETAPGEEMTIGAAGLYAAGDRTIGAPGGSIAAAAEEATIGSPQAVSSAEEATVGAAGLYAAGDRTIGAPGGSIAVAAEEATIGSPQAVDSAEEATVGAAGTYAAEDRTIGNPIGNQAGPIEDVTVGSPQTAAVPPRAAASVNPQKESQETTQDKAQDAYEAAWESAKQGADKKNGKKMYLLVGAAVAAVGCIIGLYAWNNKGFDVTVDGELLGSYKEGAQVTLEAEAPEGYVFQGWSLMPQLDLADRSAQTITFEMPEEAVFATPIYKSEMAIAWEEVIQTHLENPDEMYSFLLTKPLTETGKELAFRGCANSNGAANNRGIYMNAVEPTSYRQRYEYEDEKVIFFVRDNLSGENMVDSRYFEVRIHDSSLSRTVEKWMGLEDAGASLTGQWDISEEMETWAESDEKWRIGSGLTDEGWYEIDIDEDDIWIYRYRPGTATGATKERQWKLSLNENRSLSVAAGWDYTVRGTTVTALDYSYSAGEAERIRGMMESWEPVAQKLSALEEDASCFTEPMKNLTRRLTEQGWEDASDSSDKSNAAGIYTVASDTGEMERYECFLANHEENCRIRIQDYVAEDDPSVIDRRVWNIWLPYTPEEVPALSGLPFSGAGLGKSRGTVESSLGITQDMIDWAKKLDCFWDGFEVSYNEEVADGKEGLYLWFDENSDGNYKRRWNLYFLEGENGEYLQQITVVEFYGANDPEAVLNVENYGY